MNKKTILIIGLIIGLILTYVGFQYYQKIYGKSVMKTGYVYIQTNESMEGLAKKLSEFIEDSEDFLWVCEKKSYSKPRAGKFEIVEGMSNNDLINHLRSGKQIPVNVTFNNQDTLERLAGRVSKQIEADSTSLVSVLTDSSFLAKKGISKAQMLGYFIPNTYEFFWNTSAKQFRDRMLKEYKRFWNEDRLKKTKVLNMTPDEVMALASIVQKETAKAEERPRVAGLYLNRIKIGMPLQADPTIIYILKQIHGQDFVVKRVLNKDLKIKSPYNTYRNKGVPPSLIAMPDISSIDAVLNYEKHSYLYMCVNIDKLGFHSFASSLKQHNKNAAKYRRWLNQQGVYR